MLEDIPTDDLIEELMLRHRCAVFVGRPKADRDFKWRIRTVGENHENLGLCCLAQISIGKEATAEDTLVE